MCGPAVVHTGGAPDVARLVREGWIDVLFAGNGFATHDMESNVLGTSLGVSVAEGTPVEHGHSNHLRVINEVRRHGSIAAAVEAGYVTGGAMYECVRRGVPFVLGGSVRDDGPLPDTMADVVEAADAMRAHRSRRHRCADAGVDVARDRDRATCCRPASRRSASTSTRRWSPSWPIVEATRRWGSSPTSARSSIDSPRRSRSERAVVGAALPHVPAPPLRRALRDQPVDAPRGCRRPGPQRAAVAPARRHPPRRRRGDRAPRAAAARARPRVHRERRARRRPGLRPEPLPPPRAPARDGGVRGMVRRARLAGRRTSRSTSVTRAPAMRSRSTTRCCRVTALAPTWPPVRSSPRCSAFPYARSSSSTNGCTTSTSRSVRSTIAGRCARRRAGTSTAARWSRLCARAVVARGR